MSISPVSAAPLPSNPLPNPVQARSNKPTASTPPVSTLVQTAAQEAAETPAQTAQEASKGDLQAQRSLAARAAPTPTVNTSGQAIGTVVNTKA